MKTRGGCTRIGSNDIQPGPWDNAGGGYGDIFSQLGVGGMRMNMGDLEGMFWLVLHCQSFKDSRPFSKIFILIFIFFYFIFIIFSLKMLYMYELYFLKNFKNFHFIVIAQVSPCATGNLL